MKYALIHGSRICEFGVPFTVHEGLQWVEVPDDTTTADTYVDGQVVKPIVPPTTPLTEILRLESEVTPRRIREAILGTDGGWLANQEALIAAERSKL